MRLTLDTNQLVRALMRPARLATFVMAWEARRFSVICSMPLREEYQRVLAYPDIAKLIDPELRRAFQSHLLNDMDLVALPHIPPLCRDPDDDKVIATALFGMVDYLVTADQDLQTEAITEVLHGVGISIVTLDELMLRLDQLKD